jgi:hypothetical protein
MKYNPVAKNLYKFNKPKVEKNKKKFNKKVKHKSKDYDNIIIIYYHNLLFI